MLMNTLKIEGTCWGNTLGTQGTCWKHDGNTMGSTKIQKGRRMYFQRRNLPILITTYPWSCQCSFFPCHMSQSHAKVIKNQGVKRGIKVWGLCPLLWHERSSQLNDILKLSAP
jgi:hypothetical protein